MQDWVFNYFFLATGFLAIGFFATGLAATFLAAGFTAALVAGFYELMIDKDIKENIDEKTTSIKETKNTEEKQDKKDDEMMDGVTLNYQSSIRIEKNNEIIYF